MDSTKKFRRNIVRSALMAALAGVGAGTVVATIASVAHADTCTASNRAVHLRLKDGARLALMYSDDTIVGSYYVDSAGVVNAPKVSTDYVLSNGTIVRIGDLNTNIKIIGPITGAEGWVQEGDPWVQYTPPAPDGWVQGGDPWVQYTPPEPDGWVQGGDPWVQYTPPEGAWVQEGDPWVQYIPPKKVMYEGDSLVTTGGFTTRAAVNVSFTDTNGVLRVYKNNNFTEALPDGVYALTSDTDTFSVLSGVVVSGQASFLCYANGN